MLSTRWPFNFTLFIAGVFGLAAGGSPNFVTLAALFAVVGFGVGGNMPVDSAVFLDFVPGSHQYLLTILSIWWAIGQLVASLVRHHGRGTLPRCCSLLHTTDRVAAYLQYVVS